MFVMWINLVWTARGNMHMGILHILQAFTKARNLISEYSIQIHAIQKKIVMRGITNLKKSVIKHVHITAWPKYCTLDFFCGGLDNNPQKCVRNFRRQIVPCIFFFYNRQPSHRPYIPGEHPFFRDHRHGLTANSKSWLVAIFWLITIAILIPSLVGSDGLLFGKTWVDVFKCVSVFF